MVSVLYIDRISQRLLAVAQTERQGQDWRVKDQTEHTGVSAGHAQ
jgi:hypothetical protein